MLIGLLDCKKAYNYLIYNKILVKPMVSLSCAKKQKKECKANVKNKKKD